MARATGSADGEGEAILSSPDVVTCPPSADPLGGIDPWQVARWLIVAAVDDDDDHVDLRVGFAETVGEVLSIVSGMVTTTEALLGVWDLDSDEGEESVGITITVSLSDDPETTHERVLPGPDAGDVGLDQ